MTSAVSFFTSGAVGGGIAGAQPKPIHAWRASDLSLAPYIGSGTTAITRAGNTAQVMNSSGLLETVNANLARYDYTLHTTPDTSGFGRNAITMGWNPPTVETAPLAGLGFDGFLGRATSMGLNAGASGFGVADADGSMEVQCTIRRGRTGNAEFLLAVARRDGISFNWALYIDTNDKLGFGMRRNDGTFVTTLGTTSLG